MFSFIGRDGLTHNMLEVIHNHWKHAEAVRIKCMGVPTVDMTNICSQLEVFSFCIFKIPCYQVIVVTNGVCFR